MGSLSNGFFFKKIFLLKNEEEDLGSDIHIVWEKRSHELVLCHSLMVDSFLGSKSSFFFASLWLYVFFLVQNWIWSGIHMLDTGGVIKDWVWVLGFALKFENWAWMWIYMNESTVLLSLLLLLLCCCNAILTRWANLHARR